MTDDDRTPEELADVDAVCREAVIRAYLIAGNQSRQDRDRATAIDARLRHLDDNRRKGIR